MTESTLPATVTATLAQENADLRAEVARLQAKCNSLEADNIQLAAQLAAAGEGWIPVPDGGPYKMLCGCGDPAHEASIEIFDNLLRVWDGPDSMAQVFLPEGCALMRRPLPQQAQAAQGEG